MKTKLTPAEKTYLKKSAALRRAWRELYNAKADPEKIEAAYQSFMDFTINMEPNK